MVGITAEELIGDRRRFLKATCPQAIESSFNGYTGCFCRFGAHSISQKIF
jgi:hypothetical protein